MFNHFRIIVILCLISSLARFVLDSYLPSLPAISHDFGISSTSTQFTLTLYLVGFSFSQLIYGPLSDRYGRRSIILIGLGIFIIGNLGCAIASTPGLLIFARLISGVGAGACGVLNRAIASDCFKGSEFSKAWSYTTTTLVITLCAAPILGGYVQELWGWRANFILATIVVVIVFSIILKYLPETNPQKINSTIERSSVSFNKIIRDYYSIFTAPSFLNGTLCYTLAFSGLIAYFQISPLLFINHFGLSPSQYGWCSLIIAGNYLVGGFIVNKFACRMGTQSLLIIGAFLLITGGVLMWLANIYSYDSVTAVIVPAAIYVIGARIVIPNAIAGSMENVRHLNGSSSALIGFIQMLGSSLISFWIANFNNSSSLPLAIFLTALGCMSFIISLWIILPKFKLGIRYTKIVVKKNLSIALEKSDQWIRHKIDYFCTMIPQSYYEFCSPYFFICKKMFFKFFRMGFFRKKTRLNNRA
ncbi:MAG: multidrug effflux MFS transporter [Gammaproteobacteria bacterium]